MARPLGISILGGLVILAAVILILIAIASFVVGLAFVLPFRETGTTLLLNALLYFAIGVVLGVAGSGLLRMGAGAGGGALLAPVGPLGDLGYTPDHGVTAGEQTSLLATFLPACGGGILGDLPRVPPS